MAENASGLEVRYEVDSELIRSEVLGDSVAVECHANDARDAFEAMGWAADR